jgi:hypothetical protein
MENVSDKSFRENRNIFDVQQHFSEKCSVYETMLRILVDADWPQMTI